MADRQMQMNCGDALDVLMTFQDGVFQTCVTSPPYYALRDYGVNGQIGCERTPEEYIARLVKIFHEVKRVLRDDGTLWVNIGDTYAHDSKWGGSTGGKHVKALHGDSGIGRRKTYTGLKEKDMIGIPWMLAFALRADGWFLRQDIIWQKPNAMPESVKDRCVKSHEYIFLLSKSARYFFDYEAIREPVKDSTVKRMSQDVEHQTGSDRIPGKSNGNMKAVLPRYGGKKYTEHPNSFYRTKSGHMYVFSPMRNKRDVWTVATVPHKEAHFAMFPEKLIEPCILSGSRVGDEVLDPFAGGGTTGIVAERLGRRFTGIEINPEYIEIARKRMKEAENGRQGS